MQGVSRRTMLSGAAAAAAALAARPVRAASRDRLIINGLGDIGDPSLDAMSKVYPGLELHRGEKICLYPKSRWSGILRRGRTELALNRP